jgi:MFS transporter, DHA2 family, multidrug resistance protein
MTSASEAAPWVPVGNRWLIAFVVTLAAFMELLDTTIVNVALPHIAGSMSSSQDQATWALTSYLIANGIVLPISGFFSRLFGRKLYFSVCIIAFTACSFLCGMADSLPQLIVFRLLQGLFGGGLQPAQQSIILDTFALEERSRAFALTAVAAVIAPVIGPTLGGWITDNFTWRWVFFINVPVGIVAFVGVSSLVRDPPWARRQGRSHIDYIGLGLIALGLGCLQVVLDRGEDDDWLASPMIRVFAVLAIVGVVGAVFWLLYERRPLVNLRLLADRNFAVGSVMMFLIGFVLYSSAVLIPVLLQRYFGYDATHAGLALFPSALVVALAIVVVSRIMGHVQTRYVVAACLVELALGMLYSHNLTYAADFATFAELRVLQTVGVGVLFVPVSTLAYLTLKKENNADGAALFTMFRNVSGSIGISVATSLVTSWSQVHQAHLADHLTPFSRPTTDLLARGTRVFVDRGYTPADALHAASGWVLDQLMAQAALLAYLDVFELYAVMALAVLPLIWLFSPVKARQAMPGAE